MQKCSLWYDNDVYKKDNWHTNILFWLPTITYYILHASFSVLKRSKSRTMNKQSDAIFFLHICTFFTWWLYLQMTRHDLAYLSGLKNSHKKLLVPSVFCLFVFLRGCAPVSAAFSPTALLSFFSPITCPWSSLSNDTAVLYMVLWLTVWSNLS